MRTKAEVQNDMMNFLRLLNEYNHLIDESTSMPSFMRVRNWETTINDANTKRKEAIEAKK